MDCKTNKDDLPFASVLKLIFKTVLEMLKKSKNLVHLRKIHEDSCLLIDTSKCIWHSNINIQNALYLCSETTGNYR